MGPGRLSVLSETGGGYLFMLSHREQTLKALRALLNEMAPSN